MSYKTEFKTGPMEGRLAVHPLSKAFYSILNSFMDSHKGGYLITTSDEHGNILAQFNPGGVKYDANFMKMIKIFKANKRPSGGNSIVEKNK